MVSSYAPPLLLETALPVFGWLYLFWRNARDRQGVYAVACLIMAGAFLDGFINSYLTWYVEQLARPDANMQRILLKLFLMDVATLIFCYSYKPVKNENAAG